MESNLNLELIEKVKSGVACIEHTQNEKDLEKLTKVIKYLFPNDTAQILGMGKYYYTFNKSLPAWWQSQEKPDGMEAIPLSAFFTNELPKEDKQLISKIDELLGQLKTISQSVFELREHASLVLPDIAPIEQVEQPKWKDGEWAWNNPNKTILALIKEINGDKVNVDNQNGLIEWWGYKNIMVKPTHEEIEQHLTKIAIEKYPVGTKVKCLSGIDTLDIIPKDFEYIYERGELCVFSKCKGNRQFAVVWATNDSWATLVKEEVKEWYNVTVHPFKHNINDNRITIYYNDGELSTQQANVLVTQIKALLKTI